jgi:hypothetical protein
MSFPGKEHGFEAAFVGFSHHTWLRGIAANIGSKR